ncbi:cysteine hydrolase [Pseudoalteromonas sp. CO348]|uniref:Cysteine hydrolase n=1 Tax=Pseudoalteromonas maricaloris TaxID=184924 RepID=A0A8I2H7K9_9GAMM|nr:MULTISPECIES: cysteine hydrolase family protein [Pseudoalteromonas]MCG7541227.1 cysteine hydrolase [Pseudoalteromonas sp. OF7H-1]NLR22634.1 cysteine hydrolase [Pseudoalteromonas maricaloris]RZG04389.1 cysteine hydrolase [Pseudoalteromonas sp. CO348]RZG14720.1 cysteine hydrolase [Pseudoalteromonas sp. CO342X]WOX29560.1 cysteine hydrolase family protein [Pseudoalteromonas maricaloris]
MKSALLVVDVQNGVFGSTNPPYLSENVISNIKQLLGYASSSEIEIVFIQHEIPGVLEPESDAWQLFSDLTINDSSYKVRKRTPDSFQDTDLRGYLNENGVEHVLICGYSTEFCIDRTAFSAANKGYKVTLIEDAHTTHGKPHLDAPSIISHHNFTLSKHPNIALSSTAALISG